jgi:hypothetical protein
MFSRTFRPSQNVLSANNKVQHRNPQICIHDIKGIELAFPVFKQSKAIKALNCVVMRIGSSGGDGEGKGKIVPCA